MIAQKNQLQTIIMILYDKKILHIYELTVPLTLDILYAIIIRVWRLGVVLDTRD